MSLIIAIKSRDGAVLASDSFFTCPDGPIQSAVNAAAKSAGATARVYQTVTGPKVFVLKPPHQGIAVAFTGKLNTPVAGIIAEIEAGLPPERLRVTDYAERIHRVLAEHQRKAMSTQTETSDADWETLPYSAVALVVGADEGLPEVCVYEADASQPEPIERHAGAFGIAYAGIRHVVDRLLLGYDTSLISAVSTLSPPPKTCLVPPLAGMTLDESVEFASFLIRTTADLFRVLAPYVYSAVGLPVTALTVRAGAGVEWATPRGEERRNIEWRVYDPERDFTLSGEAPPELAQAVSLTYTVK